MSEQNQNQNSNSVQVILALITLAGTLGVALIAKWNPDDSNDQKKLIKLPPPPSQLEQYLKKPDWRKADGETGIALFKSETINPVDIEKLSCEDLKETDKLWSENSGGKFGFTSQMNKWEESGGNGASFAVNVGWQKADGSTITYNEMLQKFSLSSAKDGQLPRKYLWKFNKQDQFQQFFDKLRSCNS
jgi:hypothetical protein